MNLKQIRELAEAAIPTTAKLDGMTMIDGQAEFYFHKAANPQVILAMLDLMELQHEALCTMAYTAEHFDKKALAVARYDQFNKEQ